MKYLFILISVALIGCKSNEEKGNRTEINEVRKCTRDFYLVPVGESDHPHVLLSEATHMIRFDTTGYGGESANFLKLEEGKEVKYLEKFQYSHPVSGDWMIHVGEIYDPETARFYYAKKTGDGKPELPW